MRKLEEDLLRTWLKKPGMRAALQKEFPSEPTTLKGLSASFIKWVCRMTDCGYSDAELDALFRFLNAEGVVQYDGTLVHVPRET